MVHLERFLFPEKFPLALFNGEKIHAGAADKKSDEGRRGLVVEFGGTARLFDDSVSHDRDLVGKGQRLLLIVSHVDHREFQFGLNLFEFTTQFPFLPRIDHGKRLVQ